MMFERVHVMPGAGRRVRLPGGTIVPPQGVICERTAFVERRLGCGDLVLAPVAPVAEAPAKAVAEKKGA